MPLQLTFQKRAQTAKLHQQLHQQIFQNKPNDKHIFLAVIGTEYTAFRPFHQIGVFQIILQEINGQNVQI
jgi:hypothetical protein